MLRRISRPPMASKTPNGSEAPDGSAPPWSGSPLAAAGIALAAAAAYAGALRAPFVLDDHLTVTDNASIRSLRHLGRVLAPDSINMAGRPLLNLSFALNWAVGGATPEGCRAVNLAIHIFAALALFGLVRRTLLLPASGAKWGGAAGPIAATTALLWALHPLQTEAVTYVTERAESLMGMFYLLTLYAFVRGAGGGSRRWFAASAAACWLGMATKEVMVTAPVVVLAFDRAFVSASWSEALRRRRGYYAALASSWILLGLLLAGPGWRGRTVGFGANVSPWVYALTEARAVFHYVRLAVWPHPLVFDYGGPEVLVRRLWVAFPYLLLVAAGAAAAVAAWRRSPPLGFLFGSVFVLLSPSSSIVPLALQPIAEHRMYLPLAPLLAAIVVGAYSRAGRRALLALVAVAALFGVLTWERNQTYRSALALWSDTIAHRPENARGQNNLGNELARDPARLAEAVEHYRAALRIRPDFAQAHYDLALAREKMPGGETEALDEYGTALRLDPGYADALAHRADLLSRLPGRLAEAIGDYEALLALDPGYPHAEYNLGNALVRSRRDAEAIEHYRRAVALDPGDARAHNNLANELARAPGRAGEALEQYADALALDPMLVAAHFNRGVIYWRAGRNAEALADFEAVVRLEPDNRKAAAIVESLKRSLAR